MKNRFWVILGVIIIIGIISFPVGSYFYNSRYHAWVKDQPEKYCYQTFYGPPNPALVITDLNYKNNLVEYYEFIAENPREDKGIGVPLKTLPIREKVYLLGYTKDSLLAEIVSYYDRGVRLGGSYLRGWVYAKTIHDLPVPEDYEPPEVQHKIELGD